MANPGKSLEVVDRAQVDGLADDQVEQLPSDSDRGLETALVHAVPARTASRRTRERNQIAAFQRRWVTPADDSLMLICNFKIQFELFRHISACKRSSDGVKYEDEECSGTVIDQEKVEEACTKLFSKLDASVKLRKSAHRRWLLNDLTGTLSTDWESMDASQPWLLFWITHGISLLSNSDDDCPLLPEAVVDGCINLLRSCQDSVTGGFGGGPKQFAHLAPTYAAVNCLATLRCRKAYDVVDRVKLYSFIESLKQPDGSFWVHAASGENDVRAGKRNISAKNTINENPFRAAAHICPVNFFHLGTVYCAINVCTLLNIPNRQQLFDDIVVNWIGSCQKYQGGFGEVPGAEAHGGYTYCAVAALFMLSALSTINVQQCLRWCTQQQKPFEGGFCGRSNKLVDSCYSLWTGGAIPLLQNELMRQTQSSSAATTAALKPDFWVFDTGALQEYVFLCCQAAGSAGGLRDKPGKPVDFYHTAYSLAGASLAQHQPNGEQHVFGDAENLLTPVHPAHNITVDAYADIHRYFYTDDDEGRDDRDDAEKRSDTAQSDSGDRSKKS